MTVHRFDVALRASENEQGQLVGHAAVFGQMADLGRAGYEVIERGAFDDALERGDADVRALVNHDPSKLLGRQSAGTLKLDVDERGLSFEVDLPDTSYANDVRALMRRGDLDGMSFGFIPGENRHTRAADGRGVVHRAKVSRLVDVSVVTFPTYGAATAQLRSEQIAGTSNRSRLVQARHRVLFTTI